MSRKQRLMRRLAHFRAARRRRSRSAPPARPPASFERSAEESLLWDAESAGAAAIELDLYSTRKALWEVWVFFLSTLLRRGLLLLGMPRRPATSSRP